MPKFVFSNFATSSLREAVGPNDTELQLNVDDVWKFPSLISGAVFPLIIAASDELLEIVYVTGLTLDGTATVERGQEGTAAQSWLGGTHLRHSFTAASVVGAAGFKPKGTWSAAAAYDAGDVVTHVGVSYIATVPSINSAPSNVSPNWQIVYQPPGAASSALNNAGRWSNSTAYTVGQIVERSGRQWVANAAHTGSEPAYGNANWTHLAKWSGQAFHLPILPFAGTNNYTVELQPGEAPAALYDGLTILARFANANSGNVTFTINTLPPTPARRHIGVEFSPADIRPGEPYLFTYNAGTGEFLPARGPGADQGTKLELSQRGKLPGEIMDWAGPNVPGGYLPCDGRAVSRTGYPALWANLGATWGAGDGATTFNLPDLRGRTTVGVDSPLTNRISGYFADSNVVGKVGGSKEPQAHAHGVNDPGHAHGVYDPGHAHGVNDPGHFHYLGDNLPGGGGGGYPGYDGTGDRGSGRNSDTRGTGISIQGSGTGIGIHASGTGVTIQNAFAGGSGNLPPMATVNKLIYTGVH